ncbi:transcriptional regulator [Halorubrum ezzemoulense]|uniref:Transcriptional regulator n=1 Tax=Halorubrum ezzemoulense TaxID=337243 RepID=A0A256JZG5_HALEZ|nr:winged helix-turn-helix domain-containing protein [Halorubrum ezzemoulense]OYR68498.1 transcriptional regulator [Halorubrum ezzemoulense]OYR73762.1 transcriptional regulator [Halorubrum ezzemoulense]
MRKPADWMQMPTDDRILEALEGGLRLTPAVIAENIEKSRTHVSRRLSDLTDYGLVEKPKRGYYEITELGRGYLTGNVDATDLEDE